MFFFSLSLFFLFLYLCDCDINRVVFLSFVSSLRNKKYVYVCIIIFNLFIFSFRFRHFSAFIKYDFYFLFIHSFSPSFALSLCGCALFHKFVFFMYVHTYNDYCINIILNVELAFVVVVGFCNHFFSLLLFLFDRWLMHIVSGAM